MKRMLGVFSMLMLLSSNFMPVLTYANGDDPEEPETPAVNEQGQGDNQDNMDNGDSGDNSGDTNDVDSGDNDNGDSGDDTGDTDDSNSGDSDNDGDNNPQISNTLLSSPAQLLMNPSTPDPTDNQDSGNEQTDNDQSVTDSNDAPETAEEYLNRCFEYEYNDAGTLILNRFLCNETDVLIPTSGSGDDKYTSIVDGAFLGKTVESIVFPEKVNVQPYAFSGTTFRGNITIDKNVSWSTPFGFTVAENSVLTFKNYISQMYYVNVNGKLVYDITDYRNLYNIPSLGISYFLVKSRINGEVEVKGFSGIMSYSFMDSEITENGKVVIGEGINHITSYSFGKYDDSATSINNGTIVFPESLQQITHYSFGETEINGNLVFPSSLNNLDNSFGESIVNSDIVFQSEGEMRNFNFNSSFGNSIIGGDLIFSGLNMSLYGLSPRGVSGNVSFINSNFSSLYNLFALGNTVVSGSINFINTDLNLNGGYFFQATNILGDFNMSGNIIRLSSSVPVALKIKGSLNITGDNLKLPSFTWSQISGDVNIYGNTLDLMYAFNDSKINGNFTIHGKDIVAKYGSLNRLKIDGDVLIKGEYIDFYVDVFNNSTIGGDFTIDAGLLEAMYSALNYLNVLGDLKLPDNSSFGEGVLGGFISKNNKVIATETTVSIGNTVNNAPLDSGVQIVADELDDSVVQTTDNVTTVQDKEIVVSSGKVAEYQGGLEISFHDQTDNNKIEGTAKFSAPISVKVPVNNPTSEYVKVKVKHAGDEEFGFVGLTLNQQNQCVDGEPKFDKYNGEDILVEQKNGERFVVIYTCSASTFVAYSEGDPYVPSKNSGFGGGGSGLFRTPAIVNEEHNSAEEITAVEKIEESKVETVKEIKKKITRVEEKTLTRGQVAVMTNILLGVYPQLLEGRGEINGIGMACNNYADEENFADNEKRAVTKLCRLGIMGIHKENNLPLEEFMVGRNIHNDEFITIVDRIIDQYTEKDFSEIKEVLSKLEGNESDMKFGTLYSVFMSIKKILD